MNSILRTVVIVLGFLLSGVTAYAQIPLNTVPFVNYGSREELVVSISPKYPQPHQEISLTVENFLRNLASALITWKVDGTTVASGIGATETSFITGNRGSSHTITVSAETGEDLLEKTIIVRPATVDLLWEADSYTPPFYKGKALLADQSDALIIAMPDHPNPSTLSYQWRQNGTILGSSSGIGRNTLFVPGTINTRPKTFTVTVTDPSGTYAAEQSVLVQNRSPFVLLYENHPLYGTFFNRALLDETVLNDTESTLVATPFYFQNNNQALEYTWKVNGQTSLSGPGENRVTFGATQAGRSEISVTVRNLGKVLQSAGKNLIISTTYE